MDTGKNKSNDDVSKEESHLCSNTQNHEEGERNLDDVLPSESEQSSLNTCVEQYENSFNSESINTEDHCEDNHFENMSESNNAEIKHSTDFSDCKLPENPINKLEENPDSKLVNINSTENPVNKLEENPENDPAQQSSSVIRIDLNDVEHQNTNENNIPSHPSDTTSQISNSVCPDPLNILAQSYEDCEPVTYFSGIVDHITQTDAATAAKENANESYSLKYSSTYTDQKNAEFSVTDLLANETINDIFDKVYETECRDEILKGYESTPTVHCPSNTDFEIQSNVGMSSPVKSSLKRPSNYEENGKDDSPCKKTKRGITFDSVSVYYFPRIQGFTCIPSQGGSTLGMSRNHSYTRKFSLGEHAVEQRRAHRQYCSQQLSKSWNELSTMSSDDSDSDEVVSDSEVDYENYNFLQPIPTRERRAMLRACGVHKIDSGEKDECRSIRLSREFCGCTCEIYCDPESCVCAQAGIKCQVDRMNFPCSCTKDGCANMNGRVEFNPVRVRTHHIHTLMRLEMEKKKEEENEQRERLMLGGVEDLNQFYAPSSSSHAVNDNLMNFSYNNLNLYYQQQQHQPSEYVESLSPSAIASCFNFSYSPSSPGFGITTTNASYHTMPVAANSRLTITEDDAIAAATTAQYCSPLVSETTDQCSPVPHYNGNSTLSETNQDFVIRDLTNSTKNDDNSEVSYNAESFIPLNENFEQQQQQIDSASQSENVVDTSAEVSQETEKEESDTENFGDIIKKTMVESSVIA